MLLSSCRNVLVSSVWLRGRRLPSRFRIDPLLVGIDLEKVVDHNEYHGDSA